MLRFDRFLMTRSRALDLASGNVVELERVAQNRQSPALFTSQYGRSLIDVEPLTRGRVEVWERWDRPSPPRALATQVTDFIELIECAKQGAPRAFELPVHRASEGEYLRRALAREARVRGWVPIAVELLAGVTHRRRRWPVWLAERSLVVFAETSGLSGDAVLALLRLAQRDTRPHVLVRTLTMRRQKAWPFSMTRSAPPAVHEAISKYGATMDTRLEGAVDLEIEAAARWALMIEDARGGPAIAQRTLDLADVLVAREQPFEARALANSAAAAAPEIRDRSNSLLSRLDNLGTAQTLRQKGWEMVDEFVGVLQICQDVEDERLALARVGSYLRDRLQASSIAFVAREGQTPRVLSRVGCDAAALDLAMRSMDAGVAMPATRDLGPTESAYPVRHAAEVIGALWCRWSAGTPVAAQHAGSLLGVAAAAAAPSVRLAIAHAAPPRAVNAVPELVGDSRAMDQVRDAIVRAAASPFPVVIEGESGSGKELAARAIHARSARRDRRFCAINCAALVDDLVEAELFGHVRGAFTGASVDRPGVFEEAHGGTLLLDEVAELSARVQAKLLRTLQEGEIRRLGESHVRKIDVRIVAATNRPLAQEVEARRFREDLWYRLDVVRITLPALRERLEDLPILVTHLWRQLAERAGSRASPSPAAISALASYDWPGNVRELQNVLASLLVSAPRAGLIGPSVLPRHIARAAAWERASTLDEARRQFEERFVRAALARAGGSLVVAARELGLSRQGLSKTLNRLGIERLG